ncbi:MAG: YgeY family selenium metabolism-linked hydrolase [Synergistota bacterium]|nr:YgeY family selenium metabolism-linked hydrolase [Synergistota bacterium]
MPGWCCPVLNTARESELVRICQEFVRIPSESGNERQMASFVRDVMLSLGYDRAEIDSCGNVTGTIDLGGDGPCLLFEAQMDHVDVADPFEWEFYPFGGILQSGRIYGRGATDQKGSLAAMICAASFLKEDRHPECAGRIAVSATVHQERIEGASSRFVCSSHHPDLVVSGEASALKIERGQRGRAEIIVETLGKPAHSANPEYGINAANHMVSLVSVLSGSFRPVTDPFLGEGILELTRLVSYPETATGVVPSRCQAVFDRRVILGETRDGILSQIEEIIGEAGRSIPGLKASARISSSEERCYTGVQIKGEHFVPAWLLEREHPFVKRCLEGLDSIGLPPIVADRPGFGTNGCYYGGVRKIPTVAFGPSFQDLAHITDEYLEVDQLLKGCLGYYGIAGAVLGN